MERDSSFRSFRPGLDSPQVVVLFLCSERALHRCRPHPGKSFSVDGFIPSLRLERFADGLEDYDLLKLVERKKSRTAALEILSKVYKSNTEIAVRASAVTNFKKGLLEALTK